MFLVDDHPAVRQALQDAIKKEKGIDVCGEAATSGEAFRQIEEITPDVVVLDISLEDAHGLDLLETLQAFVSETEALVYSMYNEEVYAERAIRAGALGYLEKSEPPKKIIEAIQSVAGGEVYLSQRMFSESLKKVTGRAQSEKATPESAQSESKHPVKVLSDRELIVFQMTGLGYSRAEIQERLNLARKTVEFHRRGVKKKLNCGSFHELYWRAVEWTHVQPSFPAGKEEHWEPEKAGE